MSGLTQHAEIVTWPSPDAGGADVVVVTAGDQLGEAADFVARRCPAAVVVCDRAGVVRGAAQAHAASRAGASWRPTTPPRSPTPCSATQAPAGGTVRHAGEHGQDGFRAVARGRRRRRARRLTYRTVFEYRPVHGTATLPPGPSADRPAPVAGVGLPAASVPGRRPPRLRRHVHDPPRPGRAGRDARPSRHDQGGVHGRPGGLPRRRGERRSCARRSGSIRCCCSTTPSTCASASSCCRRSTASACSATAS